MCYVIFDKEVEGATLPGQKVMIIATSKLIFSYLDTARYELPDGREAWFFKEHSVIGKIIRNYWEEMIESDPEEFTNVVGIKNLASWALGRPAGPGNCRDQSKPPRCCRKLRVCAYSCHY
jgi:hypothetical protein